ncbi:MAG: type II secretory pathway pseudopilin PulG [Gammaproteobacteria bacterium]|jgi:type II secretory pathway pseudopilin PulG
MKRVTVFKVKHQQGAVLIVSLILLVVLTLLGVSVMNMTQLEERMASNSQEVIQAFQSAETGLSQAYDNPGVWNPLAPLAEVPAANIPSNVGRTDQAGYEVNFVTSTGPPPGYDVSQYQTAHFDFRSTGTANSGFTTQLNGGGFRVARNAGFL